MLTPPDKVRILGRALGLEIAFVELTRDEMIAKWRSEGYSNEDLEFFLAMLTDPPIAGDIVLPTVEEVTGEPAHSFTAWVRDHAAAFIA